MRALRDSPVVIALDGPRPSALYAVFSYLCLVPSIGGSGRKEETAGCRTIWFNSRTPMRR